jgi:hypothetical protein
MSTNQSSPGRARARWLDSVDVKKYGMTDISVMELRKEMEGDNNNNNGMKTKEPASPFTPIVVTDMENHSSLLDIEKSIRNLGLASSNTEMIEFVEDTASIRIMENSRSRRLLPKAGSFTTENISLLLAGEGETSLDSVFKDVDESSNGSVIVNNPMMQNNNNKEENLHDESRSSNQLKKKTMSTRLLGKLI